MCEHVPTARSVLVCDAPHAEPATLARLLTTAAEYGGIASRLAGGAVAFTFGAPTSAMAAAIAIQRAAGEAGADGHGVGLDHGDVECMPGVGPVGLAAHVAGQLASRCRVGEIAATDRLVDQVVAPLPASTISTANVVVEGVDGRVGMHVLATRTTPRCRRATAQAMASPTANSAP